MNTTQKLVLTAILCGIAVASASFLSIPMGIIRAFPVQHLVNVVLAVTVGTKYAVSGAFFVALLRNFLGLGTLFAFPGSIVGAFLAGILYKFTKNQLLAVCGEIIGTGFFGAILSYPIATLIMGREVTVFFIVPGFFFSSLVGAVLAFLILKALMPALRVVNKKII